MRETPNGQIEGPLWLISYVMHFTWKQENYLISNFFFFLFFAAAESDRGYQGDNQEKPSQVSESPGQRNKNSQGKNSTRSKVSFICSSYLFWCIGYGVFLQ